MEISACVVGIRNVFEKYVRVALPIKDYNESCANKRLAFVMCKVRIRYRFQKEGFRQFAS